MKTNIFKLSNTCAKGILIALNGLCILMALFSFGFAVVDIRILRQYGEEQASGSVPGNAIIIAASFMLIAVASSGIIGTAKNNIKVLYLYVSMLILMVLLELLVGIFVSLQRYGLEFRVTEWMRDDFFRNVTEGHTHEDQHTAIWDKLQTTYECCGLNGPEDYAAMQRAVSLSCCPKAYRARSAHAQQQLYKACVESKSYTTEGCEDEIMYALRESAECLLGVAFMCFWIEAAGMLLAMWVISNLKNSEQVYIHTVRY